MKAENVVVYIKLSDREKFKSVMEWQLYIVRQLVSANIPNDGAISWQNVPYGTITKKEVNGQMIFTWRP